MHFVQQAPPRLAVPPLARRVARASVLCLLFTLLEPSMLGRLLLPCACLVWLFLLARDLIVEISLVCLFSLSSLLFLPTASTHRSPTTHLASPLTSPPAQLYLVSSPSTPHLDTRRPPLPTSSSFHFPSLFSYFLFFFFFSFLLSFVPFLASLQSIPAAAIQPPPLGSALRLRLSASSHPHRIRPRRVFPFFPFPFFPFSCQTTPPNNTPRIVYFGSRSSRLLH